MKNKVFKIVLSLFISFLMVFTMVPATVLTFATDDTYPVMEAYNAASSGDYHKYYDKVYSVTFLDNINYDDISASDTLYSWDVSANNDASVMAWMKINSEQSTAANAERYDVYIGGEGGVRANPDSSYIFYMFSALEKINNPENFKTDNVTNFKFIFSKCYNLQHLDLSSWNTSSVTNLCGFFDMSTNANSPIIPALKSVNLSGWDTSSVTDMSYMFNNCKSLTELDLSSFDVKNVTNMDHMFYKCEELAVIYVGANWSVEQVTRSNAMFNCCYAVVGGKDIYDKEFQYVSPEIEYAKLKEDGGFLTYKEPSSPVEYTVTYEFIGDIIPENVSVPHQAYYEDGSTVTVENPPAADGYVFSGWITDDAEVNDNTFTINNNVHFVGSWSKLYTVKYEYADGYDVPEGAPELNSYTFMAGDSVTLDDIPFMDSYVFVGWNTEDVVPADGKFVMPEKDVTLYGYFKKPVESVKINGGDIVLNKDGETFINVTVKPEDATVKEIIYLSDDENVVKIDSNGKITAVAEGTATVTVYSKDDPTKKDAIIVTVKVPVIAMDVDKTDITLNIDETEKITASVNPDATNKKVTYTSADETIAIVDNDGNITAVGEGTTTIKVTSEDDPTIIKTVNVSVKIPVTEVTATDDFTLNVGEEKNVEASVNEDATNKELIYESSNPGVAKVDPDGNVIAVGEGTATITVTSSDDPSKKDTIIVTVKVPVDGIVANKENIILNIGETDNVQITIIPDDATNKEIVFESEDETVAIVDKDGNITAIGEGTTTIKISSKDDPSKNDTIIVTVKVPVVYVPVTDISASDDFSLTIGENKNVDACVNIDATNKGLTYSSSDESVATVDKYGNVTAVGEGTSTITITSDDNNKITETVVVTVIKPEYIIEAPHSVTITENKTVNLGVKVTPAEGAPEIIYVSADESIVKVDLDGNITGVGIGTTTVTADIGNGNIKVITVTVSAATVPAPLPIPIKHHVAFGKTDGIGWYEVSVNGGDFFPQGPNSTLEVDKGSILVIRVQDMWIDDDFTFYVNGKKVEKDAANCITVTVEGYMLIGALSMDFDVPDVEESLNLLQKIIKAIKEFFEMIISWFK